MRVQHYAVITALFAGVLLLASHTFAANAPVPTVAGSAAAMHNSEGIKHYNAGHLDVAEEHFREAVKADPKSGEAHYNLALTLDGEGKHKDAAAEFGEALKLAPNNPAVANSEILKKHLGKM